MRPWALVVGAAGALMIVGAFLPWAVSDAAGRSLRATEMGQWLALAAVIVCGVALVAGAALRHRWTPAAAVAAAVVVAVAATAGAVDVADALRAEGISTRRSHPGMGVNLLALSSLLAVVGTILFVRERKHDEAE